MTNQWYFFQKIGFDITIQIVSLRDSLHEMSKPIFWKNILECQLQFLHSIPGVKLSNYDFFISLFFLFVYICIIYLFIHCFLLLKWNPGNLSVSNTQVGNSVIILVSACWSGIYTWLMGVILPMKKYSFHLADKMFLQLETDGFFLKSQIIVSSR